MKLYVPGAAPGPGVDVSAPSEDLRIAVTFRGHANRQRLTEFKGRLSHVSVAEFAPAPSDVDRAIEELKKYGFVVSGRGAVTISVRGSKRDFERAFGTKLTPFALPRALGYSAPSVYYPDTGAPWKPAGPLQEFMDDAYIQWPHIYMGTRARPTSPRTPAKKRSRAAKALAGASPSQPAAPSAKAPVRVSPICLDVLKDVPRLLNATSIHKAGARGEGVRIAMIDSGFDHRHPFFKANGFLSSVVLAPGATFRETDPGSHGTGESANVFAMAPGVTFIGIKLDDDTNPTGGASILEGFQEALRHEPQVISVSMGYDLRAADERTPLSTLPNGLKALEAEIQAAIAQGTVVVFSAGNGHYAFPGQMPEVISAGGTFIDEAGVMMASNYASAFTSRIYSGRTVPDVCGLVGMQPHADYIMLPVPPGESIDRENAAFDSTGPNDGWAAFSGTSAAAPQIAGLCALLLEKNPGLSPAAVKALLERTARDVRQGNANPASDPARIGVKASAGRDGATGAGLVDAFGAWSQA